MRLATEGRIARASLVIAIILFVLGMFLLCACPGWYVCAALFAGVAVKFSKDGLTRWSKFCLIACVAMALVHLLGMLHENNQKRARKLKALQQAVEKTGTSSVSKTNSP